MKTKVCTRCDKEKDIEEFLFRNKDKGTRHSACSECYKDIRKESYERTKQTTLNRNKRNTEKKKEWFNDYKANLSCEKCGEDHPACLEFHHLNPTTKDKNVAEMINTYSQKKIQEEIDKCSVLCANCHRKEHYK